MIFDNTFWRCCSPVPVHEQTELQLPVTPRSDDIKIHLTSSIYTAEGTINWDDEDTRNALFAKGKQDMAIENYAFLYDCHRMKALVQQDHTLYTEEEKDKLVRVLAKDFFLKYITDNDIDLLVHYVEVYTELERVRSSININGNLRAEFKEINEKIESASREAIMSLYEKAAKEITGPLGLPPNPSTARSGFLQFFTQSSLSNRNGQSSERMKRDRLSSSISWARTTPTPGTNSDAG